MAISLAVRVSVPSDVLVQEIQGESVLLNLNSGRYFGLDDVGTRMWKAFTGSETIEAACRALLSEFDVGPEVLRRDVRDLVEKLVEHGLVEVSGEG